jgi:hypothetical protein
MKIRIAPILLLICLTAGCATTPRDSIVGDWRGEVQSPLGDVELIFHFRELDDELECSIDSKFQGGVTLPCGEVSMDNNRLLVTVPAIGGRYRGVLEGDEIVGQWTQAGVSFNFDLRKMD